MKKNKKILVVSLASLMILGLVGTATGLMIKKNNSSDSSSNQKDTLTSFYVDKSNINFTDDLLKFDVKAVALPSSLNLKIIWECENTTNIKLTYSESDSTKCTVECIAKFTDPLSMVCYPEGFKDNFSKTIQLNYGNIITPTDKTYTTKIYTSTTGDVDEGYSVAYTDSYTISGSSISSILALVDEDYVNTLSSYTYSSSRSNISSTDLTCNLYYYKTSTPIETTYTMALKVYIDDTLNDDTSVQFAKGYTVDLSQYKNIATTASGDWDESQYSFLSMTLDGVTKTGTETFSMEADHALVVKFVKNIPSSYSLTLHYYKDGSEDVSLRETKSIDNGTEVSPNDYKKELSGYTYQDSVPNDSFKMIDNNSIQFNYINSSPKGSVDNPLTENDLINNYIYWECYKSFCVKNVTSSDVIYNLKDKGWGDYNDNSLVYVKSGFDFKLKFLTRSGSDVRNLLRETATDIATTSPITSTGDLNNGQLYTYTIHGLSKGEAFCLETDDDGMDFANLSIMIV